jgi:hypothetical protein
MARSWEYSSRRRIAMQIVLWLIFGLTLVLAGFVSHWKQRSGLLPLGTPIKVGDLTVQFPKGWHVVPERQDDELSVIGIPGQNMAGQHTAIRIVQQRLHDPSLDAASYLSNNTLNSALQTAPITFAGLGRDGVTAEFDDPDDSDPDKAPTGLYAVTIVPTNQGKSLAVMVVVEVQVPFTRQDGELLRQIVQKVKLAPK